MFSPPLPAPPKVTHDQESLRNAKLSKFLYLRASPASPSSMTLSVLGRKISFPGPQISKKAPAAAVLLKWCKIHLGFQVFLIFSSQTLLTVVSQALCLPTREMQATKNNPVHCWVLIWDSQVDQGHSPGTTRSSVYKSKRQTQCRAFPKFLWPLKLFFRNTENHLQKYQLPLNSDKIFFPKFLKILVFWLRVSSS